MQVFYDLDSVPDSLRGGAVSIGKFDGMHLGHALIIHRLKSHAGKLCAPAVVMTFDPPPIALLRPDLGIKPICTLKRKIELIRGFHVDALIVIRTNREFLEQTAETFFFGTLRDRLHVRMIVAGKNFTFGRNRSGNDETMRDFGRRAGIGIDLVEPLQLGDEIVSSSGIRQLLRDGKVEHVNELMPLSFRLSGTVVGGEQRGRTLGFPTANLGNVQTIVPKPGIYATVAWVEGKRFAATTHIGGNPTFGQDEAKIEVFLHDFDGDLYGTELDVDMLAFLREIVRFDSKDELIRQMRVDVERSGEFSAAMLQTEEGS